MADINLRAQPLNVFGTVGDDMQIVLTVVDSGGDPIDVSGYTISAKVWRGATEVDEMTDAVSGASNNVITLSLTDTETTAIGTERGLRWSLSMTTGGITEQWVGGKFELLNAGHPKASGVSAATLTYTSGDVTVTLGSISTTALDGRYESATAAERQCIYFDGTTSNYWTTADHADWQPTTGLDVRAAVAADDWTPSGAQVVAAQYGNAGARSWELVLNTSGAPGLFVSTDGTAVTTHNATVGLAATAGLTDGALIGMRATWAVAGEVKHYYKTITPTRVREQLESDDDWTQLGTTVTASVPTTALFNAAIGVMVGATSTGANPFVGKVLGAHIEVDGAITGAVDGRILTTRQRDQTGKTWTLTGSAWVGVPAPLA